MDIKSYTIVILNVYIYYIIILYGVTYVYACDMEKEIATLDNDRFLKKAKCALTFFPFFYFLFDIVVAKMPVVVFTGYRML